MAYRNTRQRQLILDVFQECEHGFHPNADWIHNAVRYKDPKISLGTVYRNLDILCKMGIIVKIKSGNSSEFYDINPTPHYHFCCEICGCISDLHVEYNHDMDDMLRAQGYDISRHRMIFEGICEGCRAESNKIN